MLEVDAKNAKALFRRGVARLNLNSLDRAEEDLKSAQELDPKGTVGYFRAVVPFKRGHHQRLQCSSFLGIITDIAYSQVDLLLFSKDLHSS